MLGIPRAIALMLLLRGIGGASDWQRVVSTPKGDRIDSPSPHNLAYFTDFPESLDRAEPLCYLCTPAETAKRIVQIKNSPNRRQAEVRRIGTIKGFEVLDIFYSFHADGRVNLDWKSIVVKVSPVQYREIYHYQANLGGSISPSEIVGDVLATECNVGARGMMVEEYFWFDQTGPTHLDMTPILDAAERTMPTGIRLYPLALHGTVAFRSNTFRIQTIPDNSGLCCGEGLAEVRVDIDKGKIMVTSARYDPTGGK
jgi:hypothetical protein